MDCTKYIPRFPQHGNNNGSQSLETIRALHQTIVTLRTALTKSKSELQELKSKSITGIETDIFRLTIEKLSLENHILRQRILVTKNLVKDEENVENFRSSVSEKKHSNFMDQTPKEFLQTNITEKEKVLSSNEEGCDFPSKDVCTDPVGETKGKGMLENSHNQKVNDPSNAQVFERQADDITQNEKKYLVEKTASNVTVDPKEFFEDDSESEELDDIELIFTTEDTKDLPTAQENLVSITDVESWNPIEGTPILLRYSEAEQFDEVPENILERGKSKIDGNRVEKVEESLLRKKWGNSNIVETDISKCGVVDENIPSNKSQICQTSNFPSPSHHRPIIFGEKALHKGAGIFKKPAVFHDTRLPNVGLHGKPTATDISRPILTDGHTSARRESGAQTDITALPSRWRSEGYLTHKVSQNFTTLPSKFAISPSPLTSSLLPQDEAIGNLQSQNLQEQRLSAERHNIHLSEESKEARRTLLSDINFTSMVPELSRSADHLCQDVEGVKGCNTDGDQSFLMPQRTGKRYSLRKDDSLLLCDLKRGLEGYHDSKHCSARPSTWGCSMCKSSSFRQTPTSWSSIPSTPNVQEIEWNTNVPRRIHWKRSAAKSQSWGYSVPCSPTNSQLCSLTTPLNKRYLSNSLHYSGAGNRAYIWGYENPRKSGTVKTYVPQSASFTSFSGPWDLNARKRRDAKKNRVTFKEAGMFPISAFPGNSLPDLRDEYRAGLEEEIYGGSIGRGRTGNSGSGGDSTDSLIDEAEEFLRHSIDSILTDWGRVGRQNRRHSDPVRELRPPQSAQPFLPKEPKDLRPECFTKLILSTGKVAFGRVRYSGILRGSEKEEYIVGVELPAQLGDSDGTYKGIRYFHCDPKKAVFVPFNKVILAWET